MCRFTGIIGAAAASCSPTCRPNWSSRRRVPWCPWRASAMPWVIHSENCMNILVTGATGFVGASFARYALAQGVAVRATGRRVERLASLARLGAEVMAGDLADADLARRACQGVDIVVHCAGLGGHWGRE